MDDVFVKSMPKLGFGLMRLPQKDGEIDLPQTADMVDMFLDAGFRYFDTAYGYGNGASELAIGKALVERYPRDRFCLATKLPAWAGARSAEEARAIFYTSLERTGAGYFDFFLLHNLGENRTHYFDDYGIWDFLAEQKAKGLIRHLGFSFHDRADVLEGILQAHPTMDFIQLQINYLDWESGTVQSRACWETARRHGKPIIIMEPVKGGNLATPPGSVRELFASARPGDTPAAWALRFAASLDGVLTVLSGMSSVEQMADNIRTFSPFQPMTGEDLEIIGKARELISQVPTIQCTGCEYCMKGCPMHIGIPGIFRTFNMYKLFSSLNWAKGDYLWNTDAHGLARASACVGCGQCEEVCPQHLPIREELQNAARILE